MSGLGNHCCEQCQWQGSDHPLDLQPLHYFLCCNRSPLKSMWSGLLVWLKQLSEHQQWAFWIQCICSPNNSINPIIESLNKCSNTLMCSHVALLSCHPFYGPNNVISFSLTEASGNKYTGYVRSWYSSPLTPPQFTRSMPSTRVRDGGRLHLTTEYRGSPVPRAKWYRWVLESH